MYEWGKRLTDHDSSSGLPCPTFSVHLLTRQCHCVATGGVNRFEHWTDIIDEERVTFSATESVWSSSSWQEVHGIVKDTTFPSIYKWTRAALIYCIVTNTCAWSEWTCNILYCISHNMRIIIEFPVATALYSINTNIYHSKMQCDTSRAVQWRWSQPPFVWIWCQCWTPLTGCAINVTPRQSEQKRGLTEMGTYHSGGNTLRCFNGLNIIAVMCMCVWGWP